MIYVDFVRDPDVEVTELLRKDNFKVDKYTGQMNVCMINKRLTENFYKVRYHTLKVKVWHFANPM